MKYGINIEIYNEIVEVLKKYECIKEAYLFGSRARGDYKKTSDIDIAINTNEDIKLNLLRDLEEIRCIHTFDVVDVNNVSSELIKNIKTDGICIYKNNIN